MNDRVSVKDAAMMLNMGVETLRYAMRHDLFKPSLGLCVKSPGGRTSYFIYKDRLALFLKGGVVSGT